MSNNTTYDSFNLGRYVQDFARSWQVQDYQLPGQTFDYMRASELFPGYLSPMKPIRLDLVSQNVQIMLNAASERNNVLTQAYLRYSPPGYEINLNRPYW